MMYIHFISTINQQFYMLRYFSLIRRKTSVYHSYVKHIYLRTLFLSTCFLLASEFINRVFSTETQASFPVSRANYK